MARYVQQINRISRLFFCSLILASCSRSAEQVETTSGENASSLETSQKSEQTVAHSEARADSGHQQQTGDTIPVSALRPASEAEANQAESNSDALAIFKRRLLPILHAKNPSSCMECHLSGVDLKDYLLPDQKETFAALRRDGLIDVKQPEKSKILKFIRRKPEQTTLISEKVRKQELEAFRAWIYAAVKDPALLSATSDASLGSALPDEVIRHARKDRVLASFLDNIWSEIGRCINCHSPERNQRLVKKHGEQVSWIKPGDPQGTLDQAVEQGIIDVDFPDESLILMKPFVLVEHVGGPKFALGSRTDKNFRRFLNDYAAVVNKKYQSKDQLPQPAKVVTQMTGQHLRIVDLPARFDKLLLRVNIYRKLYTGWSKTPWATTDNSVNGKRHMWQSSIFVSAPRGSQRAKQFGTSANLPSGRYLIKIYIDRDDQSKKNRDYEFSEDDFFGEVEIDGEWPPGYLPDQIKIIHAPKPKR